MVVSEVVEIKLSGESMDRRCPFELEEVRRHSFSPN